MSRWPDIDWPAFGEAIDGALCELARTGISARELDYHGISRGALGRARRGVRISAANYCAVCSLLGWDPASFLLNPPVPIPDDARESVSRRTLAEPFREPRAKAGGQ